VSWSMIAHRDVHSLRVLGTRGSGTIAPLTVFKELEAGMIEVTPQLPAHREHPYTTSYRNELQEFIRAARAGTAPVPREQVELMRLVSLAYRAAAERREVEVGS